MNPIAELDPSVARNGAKNGQSTVLVIEDNELNMKLFRDLLGANGYKVLMARDGETGFRLAREHKPNLVILDMQLPEASGLEVTRWIKRDAQTAGTPVLAVTALAMQGDEAKILAAGCDAYMAKPISCGELLATVARFLA
jgi:two-component system, cell cycle response regulator DivK